MIFNKTGRKYKEDILVNGKQLEIVQSYTYLGVNITSSGTFTQAISQLIGKAKKAMMILYKTIMQFQIPLKNSISFFKTFVQPILTYNAENWTTMTDKQIIKCKNDPTKLYDLALRSPITIAQLKYSKFIYLGKHCPTVAVFGEIDEIPLQMTAYTNMIKYWDRISQMNNETLAKKAYLENLVMNTNWCKTIQVLNATLELNNITKLHGNKLYTTAKQNISNHYFLKNWKIGTEKSPKLQFYSKMKQKPKIESYMDLPTFKDRKLISRFISSNHDLEIEKGRHKKIARQNRICRACALNVIEDEQHFLTICPTYEDIRPESYLDCRTDMFGQTILNNPLQLSKYLKEAYTVSFGVKHIYHHI